MTLVSPVAATPGLPTYYAIKVLGYSVDHRPIRDHRMGSPGSGIKAVVLGQMHGDEHAGVIVADTMLLGRPVKDVDLWVIPSMNPDGNAVHTRQNAHHVNLNRNWPDHWVPQGGIFYSGPAPLSEPETKAVYAFLNSVKPTLLVSIHQPLNGVDTTDGGSRNPAFAARLAHNLHLPLKPFNCWSVCRGAMTGYRRQSRVRRQRDQHRFAPGCATHPPRDDHGGRGRHTGRSPPAHRPTGHRTPSAPTGTPVTSSPAPPTPLRSSARPTSASAEPTSPAQPTSPGAAVTPRPAKTSNGRP